MKIAITNHKGGTGKTTTTINVGCALRDLGYKVLLIDLDAQGNLSYSLGITDPQFTSADWLNSSVEFEKVKKEVSGITLVPSSTKLADFEKKFFSQMYLLTEKVKKLPYDFILLPPSIQYLYLKCPLCCKFCFDSYVVRCTFNTRSTTNTG